MGLSAMLITFLESGKTIIVYLISILFKAISFGMSIRI